MLKEDGQIGPNSSKPIVHLFGRPEPEHAPSIRRMPLKASVGTTLHQEMTWAPMAA